MMIAEFDMLLNAPGSTTPKTFIKFFLYCLSIINCAVAFQRITSELNTDLSTSDALLQASLATVFSRVNNIHLNGTVYKTIADVQTSLLCSVICLRHSSCASFSFNQVRQKKGSQSIFPDSIKLLAYSSSTVEKGLGIRTVTSLQIYIYKYIYILLLLFRELCIKLKAQKLL